MKTFNRRNRASGSTQRLVERLASLSLIHAPRRRTPRPHRGPMNGDRISHPVSLPRGPGMTASHHDHAQQGDRQP